MKDKSLAPYYPLLLAGIVLFALLVRIYDLGQPPKYYFDEVYYAFTAQRVAEGDRQAYDPWAKPPEGLAFEWTHPPLPKLLMASVMKITGDNGWGWRLGSAIAGTLAVAAAAFLALELFASWPIALLAAFFFAIEGLSISMARIATGDSYFVFFTLTGFWAYARWRKKGKTSALLTSALALGAAASCKWTALFPLAAIALDLASILLERQGRKGWAKFFLAGLAFTLIVPLVYLLSYGQFFYLGGSVKEFAELQHQMWAYHSGLKATHPFSSHPIQWILNIRPVWFYSAAPSPGMQVDIFNLGNTVILWAGFIAVLTGMRKKLLSSWENRFLLLLYFMLWVPWAVSPRVMFFYHYAPAIPLLCLILAQSVWLKVRPRKLLVALSAAAFVWFLLLLPLNIGIPMPTWFVNTFYSVIPGIEKI